MRAEELVKAGQVRAALAALKDEVRKNPADAKLRTFFFQVLCVTGDWGRALNQLHVAAGIEAARQTLKDICVPLLKCEALRAEVFAGKRQPLLFGEPREWVSYLLQGLQLLARGEQAAARQLRDQAFEAAPAIAGTVNGQHFDWIADGDTRLGPMVEGILEGRYYWIPFYAISRMIVQPPTDLRDLVWTPVIFTWTNGGQAVGFVPVRYPGSETSADEAIQLARKTTWESNEAEGTYQGLGQRVFVTDAGEFPLLECREIGLQQPDAVPPPPPGEPEAPAHA